jgi:cobalt-precorrin 5A hydrolase / precorrin-3B C17-methyltransferase
MSSKALAVGFGCSSRASPESAVEALRAALADAGLAPELVTRIGTVERRARHPAVLALADATGADVLAYEPETLDRVAVPTPSDYVRATVRTRSVAEAAALLAAGEHGALLVPKRICGDSITIAVAAIGDAGER